MSAGPGPEGDWVGGVLGQGRGSGCSSGAPSRSPAVVRTVCYMAAELLRLLGGVESMKPVLQSLFHRLLLYPPPQHRSHAIHIMKEVRKRGEEDGKGRGGGGGAGEGGGAEGGGGEKRRMCVICCVL